MNRAAFKKLLEDILNVKEGSLSEADTRESIEGWSSLTDVQILTAVWSELGVDCEADDFEFESIGELLARLDSAHAFSPG
jgi:acyl carrier protein